MKISIIFLALIMTLLSYVKLQASNYTYHHYKLHPVNPNATSLSQGNMADAIYYNQERLDELRLELIQNRKEMQAMREQMKEMQTSFDRFKTYYFRRL